MEDTGKAGNPEHAEQQWIIRDMREKDLDAVTALEQACFSDPWSKEAIESELKTHPFSHGIVLEADGVIAGYAFYWVIYESSQLANIAISPQYRRQNLGWHLLQEILSRVQEAGCENMTLEVRKSNEPAKHLYEKAGFVPLNVSKHYYGDGEDAIVMGIGF